MKKFGLLLLVFVFLTPWTAWSVPIDDLYITLSNDYNGDGDSVTGLFDEIDFYDQSRSTYDIYSTDDLAVGVTFKDVGHAIGTQLVNNDIVVSDTENMRSSAVDAGSWELTIVWELTGAIDGIYNIPGSTIVTGDYNGGIVTVYLDENPNADFGNNTADIIDDNETTFTDGVKILEGTVVDGDGKFYNFSTTGNFNRSINLTLMIDYVNTSYIQSETFDLGQLVSLHWLASIATEGNNGDTTVGYDSNGKVIVFGQGTGTIKFAAVPEPATILLLGGGLFVIGVMGRKKIIK